MTEQSCHGSDAASEKRTRWCRKPCTPAVQAVQAAGTVRQVYTIGTWRVSREVYLWQLSSLDVKLLVDIRGNPRAGREEQLFRGKDLTRALLSVGVRYEYWGDRLGEEEVEGAEAEDVQRLLKGLMASAPKGPICFFGHMHEPQKCHRLQLCNLLPTGCHVQHLLWEDHRSVRVLGHEEANSMYRRWVEYFHQRRCLEEGKRREERRRASEAGAPSAPSAPSVPSAPSAPSASGWRRAKAERERAERAERADRAGKEEAAMVAARLAEQAELQASALPILDWEALSVAEWEDRLRDGKAYRLRLPWNTEILWYPHFLDEDEASQLESKVQDRITMYHPTYYFQTPSGVVQETVNRKGQARICDDFNFGIQYDSTSDSSSTYVSQKMEVWTRSLLRRIEGASEAVFNAIWFNHYRDGTVTIHWHTDGNEGLGPDPIIGSLSLGATRDFCFKSKREWSGERKSRSGRSDATHWQGIIHLTLPLFHGSLAVMGKNSQRHWLHAVPAMEGIHRERTNLTFRFWALEGFETIDAAEAQNQSEEAAAKSGKVKFRLHVTPDAKLQHVNASKLCPVILDSPNDAATVGEMLRRLRDHVLPSGVEDVQLGAWTAGAEPHFTLLDDAEPLQKELERLGLLPQEGLPTIQVVLVGKPGHPRQGAPQSEALETALHLETEDSSITGAEDLFREVKLSGIGRYEVRGVHEVEAESGDWVWEVIQNLSGIQRKSKGKGRVSQMVFHQCSEFVALYVARSKSTVHLVLSTKRPLRLDDLVPADVGSIRRLGLYGRLLAQALKLESPQLEFQIGVRPRRGERKQLAAHLLSRDFVAPDPMDLTQQHYLEFTSGSGSFLPLEDLADRVKRRVDVQEPCKLQLRDLRCHRCGHIFGSSLRELAMHLRRCEAPLTKQGNAGGGTPQAVKLLEEMGFACGREVLCDILVKAEGSLERAVELLAT